ncbi:DUF983 domain-containing protein [Fodinicurvata sediminis]|uniref:DUF983 domain-containing protein n=1 Tax=Fodinicurvata sediminis TaxID=1121832 RepID=UPI00040B1C17|nr:DUF983 domain-containing protein [Fodinicurvata sediminis]
MFKGFLTVVEHCSICNLDLRKADSGDGPAVFLTLVLGTLLVPSALLLEVSTEPPLWVHALIWPVAITLVASLLLRPFKATMIALQYRHRASDSGTETYD